MGKFDTPSMYTFIRIGSTFGLSLGINIYLLSVLLGGWLDEKLGCAPVFRIILLFVALTMSFAYLIKQVSVAKEVEEENRKASKREDGDG
ncbi:MAG: AtpZ/AtpI family protein [Bacillota bacterium]|nr:AtpZ/AtpI family protein [Bacillota bacterium]